MLQKCYVISDLHIAEGTFRGNSYLGTENFTSDDEFADFIQGLLEDTHNPFHIDGEIKLPKHQIKKELVINGDFIDFIRITDLPKSKKDFDKWQNEVQSVKTGFQVSKDLITCKEEKYGLRTHDYKIIWKLYTAIEGHQNLFDALHNWVLRGNELRIIEGNHDPEWYWKDVQAYFKEKLSKDNRAFDKGLIHFCTASNKCGEYYQPVSGIGVGILHGHHVDKMTAFADERIMADRPDELTIPIGSFYNRYIINSIELDYPFIDNLAPKGKHILEIATSNYYNFLNYIFKYVPYLFRMLYRFQGRYISRIINLLVFVLFPILIGVYALYTIIQDKSLFNFIDSDILKFVIGLIPLSFGGIVNSFRSLLGIKKKTYQEEIIEYGKEKNLNTIIVGHNHKAEEIIIDHFKYLNSGTWTFSHAINANQFKDKHIFTFVEICHNSETGKTQCAIKIWNEVRRRIKPFNPFSQNH